MSAATSGGWSPRRWRSWAACWRSGGGARRGRGLPSQNRSRRPPAAEVSPDAARGALRAAARVALVHPRLLPPGRPRGRLLHDRHDAAAVGPAVGRAGRAALLPARPPAHGPVPGAAHDRPGPPAALLAHAAGHRRGRPGAELQVLVAHVAGRVGPAGLRRAGGADVPGGGGARRTLPLPPGRAAGVGLGPPAAGGLGGGVVVGGAGTAAIARARISPGTAAAVLALLGVIALRAAVLWSAQG